MKAWSRWQDWTNLVLGAWLFVSPWLLGFAGSAAAAWNAWLLGVVVVVFALWALAAPSSRGAQWWLVISAAWVFIAPWVLGFASVSAGAWNAWIVSVVVALAAFSALAGIGGATKGAARPSA